MTRSQENQPDGLENLEALIEAWQAGEITAQHWDQLCALLRATPAARDRFLVYRQVEAALHWKFSERSRVSAVLAEDFPRTAPTLNVSVLADGSYSRDDAYRQIVEVVANQEANDLLWAQAYPRLRSYVALCFSRPTDLEAVTSSIVKQLLDRYHDQLSPAEFMELIRNSARKVVQQRLAVVQPTTLALEESIASACLGQSEDRLAFNASVLYERLEGYIPYRLPEERLQLLCLRYLHGFTPQQIAIHLSATPKRVQLELAKARILIWKQCCEPPSQAISQSEIDHLLIVNMFLDSRTLSADTLERLRTWLAASERHRNILGSFALLHECLNRQLTVECLLESLTESKNKAFQNAVGKAIRQIELLARTAVIPPAPPVAPSTRNSWMPIAALTIAASVLVALGLLLRQPPPQLQQPQIAEVQPPAEVLLPAPPPLPPVVARVIEHLDAGQDSVPQIGGEIRQGDSLPLRNGIMELSTTSGSTLVLEAPVEVTFQSENEVSLKQGKLAGLNSTKEQTLIVHSPTATIEDLGTEFGVDVHQDGSTSVAVYQGLVAVSGALPNAEQRTLEGGWQTSIDEQGALDQAPETLAHDRDFVRPDEVRLRVAAKQGSQDARSEIAFYELLRVEGLLAYHGFGGESDDNQHSIGFRAQGLRPSQDIVLGPNLSKDPPFNARSHSIVAAHDRRYFLDLDTSEQSRLARAGLLAPGGLVGETPGEIWLSWRSQFANMQNRPPDWAGLSIMCGDGRQIDEPLFVGLLAAKSTYGIGAFEGPNRSQESKYELDSDTVADGLQPMLPDERQNLWTVQLLINPASTEVRVWCNVPIHEVATTPPNARQSINNLRFDRFRFELTSQEDPTVTVALDDLIVATSLDAVEAASHIIEDSPTGEKTE